MLLKFLAQHDIDPPLGFMKKRTTGSSPMVKKARHEDLGLDLGLGLGLPDDIVQDILLKLSVGTLTRFKCVSKSWYSLISDPSFQQDHYSRQSQQDPLLLLTRCDEFDKVSGTANFHLSTHTSNNEGTLVNNYSIPIPESYDNILNFQSCQGLICICDFLNEDILLCNPSTREITTLPPSRTSFYNLNIGFGYTASTKEFKVFRIFDYEGTQTKYDCEVLTLGTSEWRPVRNPSENQGPFYCTIPFLHGALHLLPMGDGHQNKRDCIHAFDIQNEEYTSIPLPESYFPSRHPDRGLIKFGESLCLNLHFGSILELWILKDYPNGVWAKEYIINLTSLGSNVWGEPLVGMGNGSIIMKICDELYWYNPGDRTFKEKAKEEFSAALYVESFFSPQLLFNHSVTAQPDRLHQRHLLEGCGTAHVITRSKSGGKDKKTFMLMGTCIEVDESYNPFQSGIGSKKLDGAT